MAQIFGMIIYEIIGDGCLNGVWNNNGNPKERIMNEIARKRKANTKDNEYPDEITGEYTVAWIEETGNKPDCDSLLITSSPNSSIYHFQWIDQGTILFRGSGFRIGLNRLAVTYWDGTSLRLS